MNDLFDLAPHRDNLYQTVADQIQGLIIAHSLQPGDKLPSERELAGRMGISRNVLREAIRVHRVGEHHVEVLDDGLGVAGRERGAEGVDLAVLFLDYPDSVAAVLVVAGLCLREALLPLLIAALVVADRCGVLLVELAALALPMSVG